MKLFAIMLLASSMMLSCNNSKQIISAPLKIGNVDIAKHDFPGAMTLANAKNACASLGDGWRLPTKDELNTLFEKRDQIGGFSYTEYWSSTEYNNYNTWSQNLFNGYQKTIGKNGKCKVRAVRTSKVTSNLTIY
jgi:hypothetical protein